MTKDIEMDEDLGDSKTFSYDHNVDEVDKMVNRELREGESWYVLDNKWFQTFKQYLQSCDAVNNPGPIDNSDLFKVTDNNKPKTLKEKLVEAEDFVYVPEELWNGLVKEFGLTSEKHIIKRQVMNRPTARSNYKILELYPVELKLCLHGTKQEIITAQFSQVTSLKDLEKSIRKYFNVDEESETQLWACNSLLNAYDPESESKKNDETTLVDAGLSHGAIVTLEVQNSDGTWPSSRPRFGAIATRSSKITPGLCGLMNLGNTCFMNSALQCLSNTPILTEYFIADKYWDELNVDNPLGMGGEIAKTFGDLIKAMWSGQHSFLSPREFKQAVGKFSPQFSGFQQQDCQELMAFLLDGLHEDLNRVKKKPYIEIKQEIDKRPDSIVASESWSNYLKRNDSIIVDTFHGLLKSTLVCPECDLVSVTFDPYCYLSLPLPVKRERAIDVMFVPARPITVGPEKKIKRVFKICKLMVPKVGIVLDICSAVAKAINESKEVNGFTVNPSNLIVTEVNNSRLSRIYNQDDSFTSNTDEVLIFEKLDDCTALPVYLRWDKGEESATLFGKPFFVNIKQCTYEALYSAVKNYVEILIDEPAPTTVTSKETTQNATEDEEMGAVANSDETDAISSTQLNHKTTSPPSTATSVTLTPSTSPSTTTNTSSPTIAPTTSGNEENDQPMECKEGINGGDRSFTLKLINSFGTMPLGKIEKDKPLEFGSKSFIAADFPRRFKVRSFDNEEITLRMNIQKNANTSSRSHNLSECIEQFTTVERLGEHDLWYCPRCKKRQQASKKFDIWSLPKVAIFHLKRFSYSKYWRDKLDTFVNFPLHSLDLGQYLINNPNKEKILYNLVAVANHYGGLGGGHYTAYGKNKETSSWYHFDDSNVSPATEESVVSKAAYVLLYLRQD